MAGRQRTDLTCTLEPILADGSDDDLRQFLYGLFSVARSLSEIRDRFGRTLGITGGQFHIMTAIADLQQSGEVGIKRLSTRLRLAPPNVTADVNRLLAAGLIEKRRSAADGRAVTLSMTPRGRREMAAMLPVLRATNDRMFAGIDRPTFAAALDALATIGRNAPAAVAAVAALAEADAPP